MSRFAGIALDWFWRPLDKSEHFVRETEFANVLLAWVGSGARRADLRRRGFFDRADCDLFLWPGANAFNGEMGYGELRPAPENGRRVFVLVGDDAAGGSRAGCGGRSRTAPAAPPRPISLVVSMGGAGRNEG